MLFVLLCGESVTDIRANICCRLLILSEIFLHLRYSVTKDPWLQDIEICSVFTLSNSVVVL